MTKEGNGTNDISQRMINVYGEDVPSHFTINFWAKQFRWGRRNQMGMTNQPTKTSRKLRFWS